MRRAPILAVAVLGLITSPMAWAQGNAGALEGTVRDSSSGVLSGASVVVSGDRLIGGERKVQTDAAGRFRLTELAPGLYTIAVLQPGFTTARRDQIELPAGGTIVVDFTLAVGPVSDTVRIVAPSPMVDVTSAAPSQSVDETFLRELPTTRVSASLINLVPGVANDVAFGGTAGSNAIAADGLDITEAAQQAAFLRFDQNWVQEMQVASVGAGASAGGFTGLSANLVLKSGSNRLSGLGEFWWTNPSWVSTNTGRLSAAQQSAISPAQDQPHVGRESAGGLPRPSGSPVGVRRLPAFHARRPSVRILGQRRVADGRFSVSLEAIECPRVARSSGGLRAGRPVPAGCGEPRDVLR